MKINVPIEKLNFWCRIKAAVKESIITTLLHVDDFIYVLRIDQNLNVIGDAVNLS